MVFVCVCVCVWSCECDMLTGGQHATHSSVAAAELWQAASPSLNILLSTAWAPVTNSKIARDREIETGSESQRIERTESETEEILGEEKIVSSRGRSSFMPCFSGTALDLKRSYVTKSSPPSHIRSLRPNKACKIFERGVGRGFLYGGGSVTGGIWQPNSCSHVDYPQAYNGELVRCMCVCVWGCVCWFVVVVGV